MQNRGAEGRMSVELAQDVTNCLSRVNAQRPATQLLTTTQDGPEYVPLHGIPGTVAGGAVKTDFTNSCDGLHLLEQQAQLSGPFVGNFWVKAWRNEYPWRAT